MTCGLPCWAVVVTVSMRVMSAGRGYRYLTDSVAVGDGRREPGRTLTDYYATTGCPPGRWLGTGLARVGGELRPGAVVEEVQLARLLGEGRDPVSGAALGHAYPRYATAAERIARRVDALDPGLSEVDRAAAVGRIQTEEQGRRVRRAVAGYDLTFSAPKSVSVLWALTAPGTRQQILEAHHAAIDDVIRLVEREVAATRMGATGPDGAVAQVDVAGVMAAAFDHYDSRAGDPQLHTHVVIANKVRTVLDGKWRSLDGRPIHAAMVALSEHYNATLADRLTARLGVVWQPRDRGVDRNGGWEITGVPEQLLVAFSSRGTAIEVAADRLIAQYVTDHGHRPTPATTVRLRQQATLTTRPDKQLRSLAELTEDWHHRATVALGKPTDQWTQRVFAGRVQQQLHAAEVSDATVHGVAQRVVDVVGERRSTWHRWNLHAEASRQLIGVRFAATTDRETVLARVVMAAEAASVRLTPPELAAVPVELRRSDGTSVLRPRHATVFTSAELLIAEDRLLELSRTTTGPHMPAGTVARHAGELGADQTTAVTTVATSGRVVDLLVGPAGAGKTTTMRTLRHAWEDLYGTGSVIGLAPSAAAAEVLGADLDIATETCAKWLHDSRPVRAGQLVIIDEASLAGTTTLDRIAAVVADAGGKVLLVGDPAQLAAVDAGGAFTLLAKDRDDVAELTDVRRFHHPWEAAATLQLRDGNADVLDSYSQHGRLHDGDTDTMLNAAYTAWQTDIAAGKQSLLIAPTREQVTALNQRARADRIAAGHVQPDADIALHDGTAAGVGDVIVTRRNDRRLATASGRWVRNGDRWTVHAVHPDGSLTARRTRGGTVALPSAYVGAHVELGYATTAHRAQGATVDTVHAIVTPAMTREILYVAMTRGMQANHAYTITDTPDTERHHDHDGVTADTVLAGVLRRVGAEPSAHQAVRDDQDRWSSVAQLAAEYDTIAAAAQRPRWTALIQTCGLAADRATKVITSASFGPLCAALRRAEAHGLVPEQLLPRLIEARPLDQVDDIGAVLHHRITAATTQQQQQSRHAAVANLVVGLIPAATAPMNPGTHTALQQRQQLLQQRVIDVLRTALENDEPWIRHLGPPPSDTQQRRAWTRHAATAAAYRDRYNIRTPDLLGPPPLTDTQRTDARAADSAARQSLAISQAARLRPHPCDRRSPARAHHGPTM